PELLTIEFALSRVPAVTVMPTVAVDALVNVPIAVKLPALTFNVPAPLLLNALPLFATSPVTLNVPVLLMSPFTWPPDALTTADLVTPPLIGPAVFSVPVNETFAPPLIAPVLVLVKVPPDTDAPPFSWPSLVVVPAVLVSSPETVPFV